MSDPAQDRSPAASPSSGIIAGIVLFLAAGLCFTLLDVVAKYLSRDYSIVQIGWARYVFAIAILVVMLPPGQRRRPLASHRPALQVLRAALLVCVTLMFFLAVSYLPLADVTAVGFATPLIVTALGAWWLKEKVGPRRWIAVLVGLCGVLIIVRPTGTVHWAILLALVFAFANAVFQLLTRVLSRHDSPHVSTAYLAAVGGVGLTAAVPFVWQSPDILGWVLHVVVGLMGGLGHYLLASAFGHAPASTLAPFAYLQLVWTTIAGLLVFGDFPDAWTILGAGILVASGVYLFYREARARRSVA
jgi:drug/metabolite transporter (DMT)-like permease